MLIDEVLNRGGEKRTDSTLETGHIAFIWNLVRIDCGGIHS